jgi:hypothetical protein
MSHQSHSPTFFFLGANSQANNPIERKTNNMTNRRSFIKQSSALVAGGFLSGNLFSAAQERRETFSGTGVPETIMGHRFLTLNTVVCVNSVEVTRDRNIGSDQSRNYTPEAVTTYRRAVETGFPEARITWAFSWRALHDTTANYREIRKIIAGYHRQYGDDITFIPGMYFANAYNTCEQINKDLHEGLAKASEIVGDGFRPKSVVAGFLAAPNLQYLAEKENIHVCQGTIWSQFAIDNQDGDGSICYPYYPSREHFCKPAQGKDDFIDCVNLDGWSVDFLAGRRNGYTGGHKFNSRMGVGPIETYLTYGAETGLKEVMHTTAIHFDRGFELNGFAWVPNCWELYLYVHNIAVANLTAWLKEVRKRWPDTTMITQGEFGELWRKHYKDNSFDYRFVERGSGIGGSDKDKEIRWYMNKDFRMATLKKIDGDSEPLVIDFTNYTKLAKEPQGLTRQWSLLGDINQKGTRPQDKPIPLDKLTDEQRRLLKKWKITDHVITKN